MYHQFIVNINFRYIININKLFSYIVYDIKAIYSILEKFKNIYASNIATFYL